MTDQQKIVGIPGTVGATVVHSQGAPRWVLALGLLAEGSVRPLYQGDPRSSELGVWSPDDVFERYEFGPLDL